VKLLPTVLAFAGLTLAASPAQAGTIGTTKVTGLGLGGGTFSSGVTVKHYLREGLAVQGVAGFGYGATLGADVVKEFAPLVDVPEGQLVWGLGGGAAIVSYGHAGLLGIAGVAELAWHFEDVPVEIVLDWRPVFVSGDASISGIGGIGGAGAVRYYFR
jgi:hypothetical protein